MIARTLSGPISGLVVVAALATGCSSEALDQPCRIGADCASGVCLPDGTCHDAEGASPDAAPAPDAPEGCGNLDGQLARAEFPLEPGVSASYRVGSNASVSSTGVIAPDGTRTWDLTSPMSGDRDLDFATTPLSGTWFASAFPTASFASPLSAADDLLGVYQATSAALLLVGVVSTAPGVGRTKLTYDPPVEVLRFPLANPSDWTELARVSGLAGGFVVAYDERYDIAVDAAGTAITPAGTFPVLRVRTLMTRTFGLTTTTRRTYQLDAECLGTVAMLISNDNEPNAELTTAAEAWRLGP